MNQANNKVKAKNPADQFQYQGRWVDKANFRAFVYDRAGHQKLANSHADFESLISSGLWFASKDDASKVERKQKNESTLSNSK